MGVKWFKTKLSTINLDNTFRFDYKYNSFLNDGGWNLFNSKFNNLIPLRNILIPFYENFNFEDDLEYNGIPTGKEYLDQFGEIISTQIITKDEHPNRLKYKINENCVLISSLKGARIPALSFDFDLSNYVFSNAFYVFKIKENWSKKFILYLLRTEKVKNIIDNNIYRGIGISTYKEEDLLKILIPKIDLKKQLEIIDQIQPIEAEIIIFKNSKQKPLDIINKVFGEEFDFDWELCDKYINSKFHKAKFTEIANDEFKFDISLKYKKAFELAKNNSNINWITLNELVTVKGGKRLPKGEIVLEDETDYKYIRVDDLSWDGNFDIDNIKYITENNHLSIKNYIAKKDDILLTIVGATIGKCGIVPEELDKENITENFARLIIKDKEKFNPIFILYSLMSRISQFQFSEYSGKSSQGKLALFRIKKTIIPLIEYYKQAEIVEKIKSQIDAQNSIDHQIEQKQQQINQLIENAIKKV